MIEILIVEDSPYKLETIKKLLIDDLMIEERYITTAQDIKSAKKKLTKDFFDLLILDLVLPLEQNDNPTPEKGVGFLNDINSNQILNPPIHIIGLTEFGEFKVKFEESFNNNLWHLINYNASEINWQEKLKTLINHLVATRKRFFEKHEKDIKYDVAIITALNNPEFNKVLELSSNWLEVKIPHDPIKYYSTKFTKGDKELKIIAACADQMGLTATASLSSKIILNFSPKYIFMAGICAGLKEKEINYGDIIIAEQSWDYGSGKMKEFTSGDNEHSIVFEPDPRPIQLCPDLKAKVNSFLRRTDLISKIQSDCKYTKPKIVLQARLGPVASGSYVIALESILNEIKQHQRKLIGVEMEAYGLYFAAEHTKESATKAIMIKSVSDFGDSSKTDLYQDYASYTSAQFIYNFILEELF